MLAVQRSLPSVSDRHNIYIYLHTLAQIRPLMLQNYSPHAKALGNYIIIVVDAPELKSISLELNEGSENEC